MELSHSVEKWRRHRMITVWRMNLEEYMSIWELKEKTLMGMERKYIKK
jgi:hypothetical protein